MRDRTLAEQRYSASQVRDAAAAPICLKRHQLIDPTFATELGTQVADDRVLLIGHNGRVLRPRA